MLKSNSHVSGGKILLSGGIVGKVEKKRLQRVEVRGMQEA